ncbi:hypothetical protein EXT49_10150 [Pectobacterium polaris]|nr:hypothetical protein [Pectobacterium polaris]
MLPRSTRPTRDGSNAARPETPGFWRKLCRWRGAFVGIRFNGPLATRSRRGASFRRVHAAHPKPAISSA